VIALPFIYITFIVCNVSFRMPLWSSCQSSWLQIQRSGLDSRRYQIFWVVGLKRCPLSLVSTIEELLERKNNGSGPESREYSRRSPLRWPCDTPLSAKVGTNFIDKGGRSVGIVRSRTQATLSFVNVSFIVRLALCAVLCLSAVCFFVWYVYFCVLCLIVVPLPQSKTHFQFN
jgi:hypothetical protein